MEIVNSILATVRFELSRVMTAQRMSVAVIMTLFPPTMIYILESTGTLVAPEFIICLFCGMICLLSLLLWSTSNVYAELEGKSWTFVTSRPFGRWSILFGKYLIGFCLSFLIAWIALSLCMLVAADTPFLTEEQPISATAQRYNQMILEANAMAESGIGEDIGQDNGQDNAEVTSPPMLPETPLTTGSDDEQTEGISRFMIWAYLSTLLFLASMVYSAIFSFLGVIIQRRAMAFAVGYFGIVEILFALIPAIIGKVSMSYHMFQLLFRWIGYIIPDEGEQEFLQMYGQMHPSIHLAAIFGMTLLMLGLAAFIIRTREYITLEDSQV